MKKKILTFLLAIVVIIPCAVLLTACGGTGDSGSGGPDNGGPGGSSSGGPSTSPTTHTVNFYKDDTLIETLTYSSQDEFQWMNQPYVHGDFVNNGWYLDKGTWEQYFATWELDGMSMPTEYNVYLYYKSYFKVVDGDLVKLAYNLMWNLDNGSLVVPETVTDADGTQTITKCSLSEFGEYDTFNQLESITLPSTITEISEGAFRAFPELETISYSNNSRYTVSNTLIDTETNTLIWANGEVDEIPSGIQVIGAYAFKGFEGSSMAMPDSVKRINDNAFNNSSIESITIPATVEYVGEYAFYNSYQLKTVVFEQSDDPERELVIGEKCFYATYLENVTIPFIGRTIDDSREATYLFEEGKYIRTLVVTDAKTIADRCFYNVEFFNLTLPNTLERIGSEIFYSSYAPDYLTVPFLGESRTSLKNAHLSYFLANNEYHCFNTVVVTDGGMVAPNFSTRLGRTNEIQFQKCISIVGENAFKDHRSYSLDSLIEVGIGEIQAGAFQNCLISNIKLGAGTRIIGANAFKNNYTKSEIVLPEGLQSIGNNAFENTGAETIEIPSTVTTIGAGAFKNSDKYYAPVISSLTFKGNNLISIGDNAFENIPLITSLDLPTSVTTIGDGILKKSLAIQKLTIPYASSIYSVFYGIPEQLTEVTFTHATKIDDYAFVNGISPTITTINLNNEITSIGTNAFPSSLTTINIPTSLKEIKDRAFMGCTLLTNIVLPDSLEIIGEEAFRDLPEIFDVVRVGKNVIYIGNGAFAGVEFTGVEVHADNTVFSSNGKYLTDETNKRVLIGSSDLNIANYVDFDHYAFSGIALTNVTFSNSLNSIGKYAFRNTGLTNVNLPISVQTIGDGAFLNCPVVSIKIPFVGNSRTEPTSTYEMFGETLQTTLTTAEIYDCEVLGLMSQLSKLTSVTLCDKITTFSEGEFSACSSLTEITLPRNLTELSDYAFSGCSSLVLINFNDKLTKMGRSSLAMTAFVYFEIPNTITHLGENVFYSCASLTEVYIPDSVENIDGHRYSPLFKNCRVLKYVYCEFASADAKEGFNYGWCSNNNGGETYYDAIRQSYFNCVMSEDKAWVYSKDYTELKHYRGTDKNLVIDSRVKTMDVKVFYEDNNIVSVDLSKTTITSIPETSFTRCGSLIKVILPESVDTVGDGAFLGCSSLKEINLGKIKNFYWFAFSGCVELETIDISSAVMIQMEAFAQTAFKKEVLVLPNTIKYFSDDAFAQVYSNCRFINKIFVPSSIETLLTNKANNTIYYQIYCGSATHPDPATTLPSYYYFNCIVKNDFILSKDETIVYASVKGGEVVLPESVTTIAYNMLGETTNVTSLIMTDNVTTIEYMGKANGLKHIRYSAGIRTYTSFGTNVNNKTLETVIFPDGIQYITDDGRLPSCIKAIYLPNRCYIEGYFLTNDEDSKAKILYANNHSVLSAYSKNLLTRFDEFYYYMSPESVFTIDSLLAEVGTASEKYGDTYDFTVAYDDVAIKNYKGEAVTHLVMPDGIKVIYSGFVGLGLETVDFNDVEYIFGGFGSNNFTQIDFTNIKFIGENAFANCELLESVDLKDAVEVKSYAFSSCESLTSIKLGASLKTLRFGAFSSCNALTTIYIPSTIERIIESDYNAATSVCYGCVDSLVIYTDAEEAPENWNESWNRRNNTSFFETQYGVSYEEYLTIISAS